MLFLVASLLGACRPENQPDVCRPLQVTQDNERADWLYHDDSERLKRITVYDTGSQELSRSLFFYEDKKLIRRETWSGGQPLEIIHYENDGQGRVSLRESLPQRSGNFDESYARERRVYDPVGRLAQRVWEIGPKGSAGPARIEELHYDAEGQLSESLWFHAGDDTRHDTLNRARFELLPHPNVLGALWPNEPTYALAGRLPARAIFYFRDGRIDSVASFEFSYRFDDQGLAVEVQRRPLRGRADSWRVRYSCR